ncbi:DegT/DnrJ/EryC1/StrS family aminotransferase [Flavihumibacter profundi]|uniref:DegT/DnrJ/EryC1/StrS family aminotransferase n=1 Tax=Flavihumibacter profundi TaxID=2716883 RepID=UPI001CC3AFBD|nr:DegT/DnrJ/EryC1/StrS family aminotransferase [Flavihumibacter profundi]MBZ5859123.1 DegT/DnrJ/EryC1/StrS family aminotransferase [Flavihumibacter profundi]
MSNIKFDLEIKFGTIYGKEEEDAVLRVLRNNAPTSGEECLLFEKMYAEYAGVKYARVVSNGTAALFLSMIGAGIKPGDRVITSPVTWIASAAAPVTLGAEVDFVDIDPVTYNLDPNQLEDKISNNTKAVIPVHLYGQACDMDEIMTITDKHNIVVVEDAAHAIGAEYKGRKAGSIGKIGCFSFHEQKNISTLGEGGIIITNDAAVFEKIALYRSHCTRVHGKSTKYCKLDEDKFPVGKKFWWQDFDDCGYNFRMTDIQAAVGIEQLKKIDQLNQLRINNAAYITHGLKDVPGLTLPTVRTYNKHVFHLYPVMINEKEFGMNKEDFIYDMLHKYGIKVGFNYIPLHYSTAFKNRGYKKGQFPNAEKLGEEMVTLPINPRQTEEALAYLVKSIKAVRS